MKTNEYNKIANKFKKFLISEAFSPEDIINVPDEELRKEAFSPTDLKDTGILDDEYDPIKMADAIVDVVDSCLFYFSGKSNTKPQYYDEVSKQNNPDYKLALRVVVSTKPTKYTNMSKQVQEYFKFINTLDTQSPRIQMFHDKIVPEVQKRYSEWKRCDVSVVSIYEYLIVSLYI